MRQSRHAPEERVDVTTRAGRHAAPEPRPAEPDRALGVILDLQSAAGNAAIAGLLANGHIGTTGSGGAPVRVQRAASSPPIVQRQAGPPLLRVGSVGSEVAELQAALNSAGVARVPLATDGQFGGATRSAVVALQQGSGIAPDGIVGPDTRAALAMHGGHGHGPADEADLGQRVSAAVEGRVGTAGAAGGTPRGVSGEVTTGLVNGSGSFDAGTGQASGAVSTRDGSASGTYNTETGSGSGTISAGSTSASGAWDAGSQTASGQVTTGSGSSASGTYNADSGTGAGSVHTSYGDAGVSVDDTTVHASVAVPGVGNVTVDVDRPDWL